MSYENALIAYEDAEVKYARRAIKNQSLTPWPALSVGEQEKLVRRGRGDDYSTPRERSHVIREHRTVVDVDPAVG